MDDVETKPWYASKTIWAQVISVVASVATAAGVHVLENPETQSMVVGVVVAIATIVFRVVSKPTAIK